MSFAYLPTDHDSTHIDLACLVRLRQLSHRLNFNSNYLTQALAAGAQASRLLGQGIDFSESRLYQPGDDIRHIDWRVTARTGKPHTKLYEADREQPIYFIVDQGPTMQFGSQRAFKSVTAAQITAILAWAALRAGYRVGSIICGESGGCYLPAKKGEQGVLALLKALSDSSKLLEQEKIHAWDKLPFFVTQNIRPGSLVLTLSDFFNLNTHWSPLFSSLRKTSRSLAFFIYDQLEATPPPKNCYQITNGEESQRFDTRNRDVRQKHRERFSNHQEKLLALCAQQNMACLSLATQDPCLTKLTRWFGHHREAATCL